MAYQGSKSYMGDKSSSSRDDRYFDKEDDKKRGSGFTRKKICKFCSDLEYILDYKDVRMMQSFISEYGKIIPRRISGNCALHQRNLTQAVKRSRNLALVGYISMGSSSFGN
jgi:small subunit ribosomal protein S18